MKKDARARRAWEAFKAPNGARERNSGQKSTFHLCTGFVGTPLLCPVLTRLTRLTRFGRADLAYRLLFNDGYPSWFYPIKNGATTMWERWNSWTPDKGFGDDSMNSFNHYAYGAVGEWLYAAVAGIGELAPGYKRTLLRPVPHERLVHASARLECPQGEIRSGWKRVGRRLAWTVVVPPNTTALAVPPAADLSTVRIGGKPWPRHTGARAADFEGGGAIELQPGRYAFTMAYLPAPA